jgi:hypothetical protein
VDISANSDVRRRDLGEYVRDEPFTALAISALAGFVLGGGVNRRIGLAMLMMAGRVALRGAATNMVTAILLDRQDNSGRGGANPDGEDHDNGRTDY